MYHSDRSGQSIFTRPKPIDLSAARRQGYTLDIDMEDEDEELGRPLIRSDVVFDAEDSTRAPRAPMTAMPHAVQAAQNRDMEDVWAEIG